MLIHAHDAPIDHAEWRAFLATHDFGQVIAPGGREREVPIVVPTHFVYDGAETIRLHLARPNPVWAALAERPLALLSVVGAYTYVPTTWVDTEHSGYGVPTSYYAAVQATCTVEVVDDPAELASILRLQLGHFQPEGGHAPVEAGDNPYARLFPAIRGLKLTIRDPAEVRAKFKFAGNKPVALRTYLAERLAERGGSLDLEARRYLLSALNRLTTHS